MTNRIISSSLQQAAGKISENSNMSYSLQGLSNYLLLES